MDILQDDGTPRTAVEALAHRTKNRNAKSIGLKAISLKDRRGLPRVRTDALPAEGVDLLAADLPDDARQGFTRVAEKWHLSRER